MWFTSFCLATTDLWPNKDWLLLPCIINAYYAWLMISVIALPWYFYPFKAVPSNLIRSLILYAIFTSFLLINRISLMSRSIHKNNCTKNCLFFMSSLKFLHCTIVQRFICICCESVINFTMTTFYFAEYEQRLCNSR